MTSGQFHSVEISSIIVNREERQRRDISDVDDLVDSIRRLGLIHPVCITRTLELVAGERRITACRALGWTHIACHYVDELEPTTLRAIELEENIKRQQLSWQDECRAISDYHDLRRSGQADWSMDDTATALGYSNSKVSERISVAKELAAGNTLVAAAPKYSTAKGITDRAAARKDEVALASLRSTAAIPQPLLKQSIFNEDFLKWAPTYSGPKFNFIHCDFPYGIGADSFNQGAAKTHGGYDDSEDTYWSLLRGLSDNLNRLAGESCHIMFWYSMHFHQSTIDFFASHTDFRIDPFPLIWTKSDNVGILPDPSRGPRRIYETAIFGSRGDRKIVRAKSNSIAFPSVRDSHMSIKPEPMLRTFFEMFVDSNTVFLDPTCGSGGSLRAAESLHAAHVTGLEINPEFCSSAQSALEKFRRERKVNAEES